VALVACRSDPPVHKDFDALIALSRTHANLCGMPEATAIGIGIDRSYYEGPSPKRVLDRIIYTSSPDRGGHHASAIGQGYDFVATYRGRNEITREEMVRLQRTAQVWIHPYDAPRESEFFCLSALEAMAAGTPCVVSDGPALVELWGDTAKVLPRPIRYRDWRDAIDGILDDRDIWSRMSILGIEKAKQYDWSVIGPKYLKAVMS
jgi:glycosyltransferase involved in cell wall biosynthesis